MNRFHILIICVMTVTALTGPGEGIRAEESAMSLHQVIALSLKNNTGYKIAREKAHESSLKIREAWGQLWPNFSTDITGTRVGAEKGINSELLGQYDVRFIQGSITVNPGVFYNTLKAARDGHIITTHDVRRIEAETTIRAIRLYYSLMLGSEIIKLHSDSLKALEENLQVVTAGYKGGLYTRLDFLRAKVSTANEKTRLIRAENDYLSSLASLNILMGRDIDLPITPDKDSLPANIKEAVFFSQWSDAEKRKQLQLMTSDSLRNRPEIVQIQYKKKTAEDAARINESIYLWPTLFVKGDYGLNQIVRKPGTSSSTGNPLADKIINELTGSFSPTGWNETWTITLGATYRWGALLPVESGHVRGEEARSRAEQADLELEDFIKNTHLEIQQGVLKLISSSHAILSQSENIASAEESLRVAAAQFRNGIIDNTKLLDANVELTSAKTFYFQSLYEFQTAKAELNRSIGCEYFNFSDK